MTIIIVIQSKPVSHNNLLKTHFTGDPLSFPGTHLNDHLWVLGTHYMKNLSTSLLKCCKSIAVAIIVRCFCRHCCLLLDKGHFRPNQALRQSLQICGVVRECWAICKFKLMSLYSFTEEVSNVQGCSVWLTNQLIGHFSMTLGCVSSKVDSTSTLCHRATGVSFWNPLYAELSQLKHTNHIKWTGELAFYTTTLDTVWMRPDFVLVTVMLMSTCYIKSNG